MEEHSISYLIFDIESVADSALVSLIRTSGSLSPEEALRNYRSELVEKKGTDFIPYVFQVPVSIAIAKVCSDYSLDDLVVLKIENGGSKKICETFWKGWRAYDYPTLVTFNGRGFDLPLLELAAFKYGIAIPEWFEGGEFSQFKKPRNRYSSNHLDLCEILTNYGASPFVGGLNLASKLLRKAGKIDTRGDMVQDMYDSGRLEEIHRYCRCDVLDTYFVFLRLAVLRGKITLEREEELITNTRIFLEQRKENESVYGEYLDAWFNTSDFLTKNDKFL